MTSVLRPRARRTTKRAALQVALILVAFISIAPIVVLLFTAFKSNAELALNPLGPPTVWHFENFVDAWNQANIGRYALNSILVTVPTLVVVIAASSLAGYAFATMRFAGRSLIFVLFLVGLMIPPVSVVTSLSLVEQGLNLYNTLPGVIAADSALALPLAIFIMRASFLDLPGELAEAVLVDGGNQWTAFFWVMAPLARPAIAAVAVLTFLTTWNDFLFPLVLINSESLRTIPLGLADLSTQFVSNIVVIAAATALSTIPTVLTYLILQRQFLEGIAQGSIK